MALNKVKWQQFVKQAKGLDIAYVHVKREDRAGHAVVKYNAKARNGRVVTGEWSIEAKDKGAPAVDAEVKNFLDLVRKDFFVKREGGLAGETWKGAQDDEAAKAKPLVADEGGTQQ